MALEEGRGGLRASDADREQAVEVLKAAFVQDWLAKAEFEAHVGRALASRTYAELAAITAGIAAPSSAVDRRMRRPRCGNSAPAGRYLRPG